MTTPQPSQWTTPSSLPPDELEQRRVELVEALHQHEARLDADVDHDDIAALVQRRSERARSEILAALSRMEEGTYGFCVTCGQQIPANRLIAVPHTPHCTSCAGGR